MKLVINTCFGGFGVSPELLIRLIKGKSKGVKVCTVKEWSGGRQEKWYFGSHEPLKLKGYEVDGNILHKAGNIYRYDSSIRDCPVLVKLVEEMGASANGRCADLKVVEIPDDIDYTIEDYDGSEHIAEAHQTWS